MRMPPNQRVHAEHERRAGERGQLQDGREETQHERERHYLEITGTR
jgi:hypothetical protein